MTWGELAYLTALAVVGVMYLGDAINACTAAVREVAEILRKDRP